MSQATIFDAVFNWVSEAYTERCLSELRLGGALVHYGAMPIFPRFLLIQARSTCTNCGQADFDEW